MSLFFSGYRLISASRLSVLLISVLLAIPILFFLGGCGSKKKVAEKPAMELDPGQQRIAEWHRFMEDQRDSPEMEKLSSVNSYFNKMRYDEDLYLWGREDYWATPQEMLILNAGDCEDFATAKYFTLRRLDVPDERMRLTYVKSLKLKRPHMVLSYYSDPASEPLVLDSMVDEILLASRRPDLVPVYSFNGSGYWLARKQSSERLGEPDRLSLWQELLERFNREAIAAPIPQ